MRLDLFKTAEEDLLSTINVTSLVDVTLVILIIFILIAPIMEQGISLTLPKATAEKIKTKEALTVDVNASGQIFLDRFPVSLFEFQRRIRTIADFNAEQSILIRADEANKYGDIIRILDIIKDAGLTKVGFLTQPKPVTRGS